MVTKLMRFNFDLCRFIPENLYKRVWAESEDQKFWTSKTHEELENYLGMAVFEIHQYGGDDED